jgi:prepilin-type N-terminal cleavage/methylation domain-containing protein
LFDSEFLSFASRLHASRRSEAAFTALLPKVTGGARDSTRLVPRIAVFRRFFKFSPIGTGFAKTDAAGSRLTALIENAKDARETHMPFADKNSHAQNARRAVAEMKTFSASPKRDEGFSLVELLVAIGVMAIIAGFAVFMFAGNRNAYRTDDQAFLILDYLRDASRRAIAEKRPYRFEIDLTSNCVRLIKEVLPSDPAGANPIVVRQDNSQLTNFVRVDQRPTNINVAPPAPFGFTAITYATATYSVAGLSNSRNIAYLRFMSDGSVQDQGNNNISRTIYIWVPQTSGNAAQNLDQTRAITVFTGTGSARLWNYNSSSSTFVAR